MIRRRMRKNKHRFQTSTPCSVRQFPFFNPHFLNGIPKTFARQAQASRPQKAEVGSTAAHDRGPTCQSCRLLIWGHRQQRGIFFAQPRPVVRAFLFAFVMPCLKITRMPIARLLSTAGRRSNANTSWMQCFFGEFVKKILLILVKKNLQIRLECDILYKRAIAP